VLVMNVRPSSGSCRAASRTMSGSRRSRVGFFPWYLILARTIWDALTR